MSTPIRQNKNIVPGDELWLFIGEWDDTKTLDEQTSAVPVAFATQHSLNRSLATTSVSSKDHGNTSYTIPGEGSWTASTESLYSVDGFNSLNNIFNDSKMVYVQFGKIAQTVGSGIVDKEDATLWTMGNDYLHGAGYITSLQASGGHGDSATFSAEITGVGELVSVHTTPPSQYTITLNNTPALESYITVVPQAATAGTRISVIPASAGYDPDNVVITTSPSVSVNWQERDPEWQFVMPASNVTITTQLKYEATLLGSEVSYYDLDSLNSGTTSGFYLPNEDIKVYPKDPSTHGNSTYMMVTNDNTQFTWDGSSYFIASMPNYYGTSYSYMEITPTAR